MKLTTTKLSVLSTCTISATVALRAPLKSPFLWLANDIRVADELEAEMWTAKAIRVLSRVGTLTLVACEAMTRTELASEPIRMSMVQGRLPSMATGTPVDLSNMDIDLDGPTCMLPRRLSVSAPVVPITVPCAVAGRGELDTDCSVTLLRSISKELTYRAGLPSREVALPVLRWVRVRGLNDEILLELTLPSNTEAVTCTTLRWSLVNRSNVDWAPVAPVLLVPLGPIELSIPHGLVPVTAPRLARPN